MLRLFFLNLIIILSIVIALIGSLELTSYLMLKKNEDSKQSFIQEKKRYKEKIYPADIWGRKSDTILGYINRPNSKINLKGMIMRRENNDSKWIVSEVYCDKYAHTDDFSRRIVPFQKPDQISDEYLVFFGGSRTFGYGVNDDETYPYYVSRDLGVKSYSYSASGWGPGQFLALLQKKEDYFNFDKKNGTAIYYMIPGHIHRLRGFFPQYHNSLYPKFGYSRERIVYIGNHFHDKINFWEFLQKNSYSFKYFFKNVQPILYYDYGFTADVLKEIEIVLNEKSIANRLVVVLSDGFGTDWKNKFIPYINNRNIEYIDLKELFPRQTPYTLHDLDSHLSPLGNQILANSIVEYFKETDDL
ncbi:FHY3/FAR1 family protein [Pelagibacteraceae bacterium]|nr:FHY3/FAR1 family protein [Pelagibacteraceae bacterium]